MSELDRGLASPPARAPRDAASATTMAGPVRPDEAPTGDAPESPAQDQRASDGSAGPLAVGQNFGWRYHIVRQLGVGGMGAVYQAWDAELGVTVAIKVIRTEIMSDPRAAADVERRFKRELLLARQVTHKNVVRIHDLGEIDGVKYITMSFVDGIDLASLLKRDGPLTVSTVMPIARAIVSGLQAAHAAGVVHRDLKPANIMIDAEGQAMIMDFGIANSTGVTLERMPSSLSLPAGLMASATTLQTTMDGAIVGTVQYMAPEQAQGQTVDQRADLYAFGLILYDMLVGRRHDHGGSPIQELRARMAQAPPPVRSIVADVPEALDALITRCIQPDPDRRFASTGDLAAAFDRLDDTGRLIPIRRTVGLPMMAAVVLLLVALSTGVWWYTRPLPPPVEHAPVSVLIADLQNRTGDAGFDRTLEPMLKRALEGATFISAIDRTAVRGRLGVQPPDTFDAAAARELAVKQGLGVVVSGSIDRQGAGYAVAVQAVQTVTGQVIATAKGTASSRDQVLPTATTLVASVRKALGDETSESAQIFAMASVSATSLDVVRYYAASQEAASNNRFEEARQNIAKALELDPKFGLGYQILAVASRNLGQVQDAEKYINEALRHLDDMTERERFSTRGMFYRVTGDYQQCVKEYGDLIARYAADVVARNQLALCSSKLRDLRRAQDEMRQVVDMLPNRALFRDNLALYASYAGDFATGEREARAVQQPDMYARLALAFSQLGQGQLPQALESYGALQSINQQGASLAASGLGDLAAHEGRYADAIRIFQEGAAADLASKNPNRAAAKLAAQAQAHVLRRQQAAAVKAADSALLNSTEVKIRFLAARTFVEAGAVDKARDLAKGLGAEFQAEPQAYGKIVEAAIASSTGDARQAVKLLTEANGLLDTWIGHYDLGRAYLEAGQMPQADSEFDRCLKRRGETLSLFLDEEPTYAYLPPLYYYQGRVREALHSTGSADAYRTYLGIRGRSADDALAADARKRTGG